jgi:polysaccharide biosynthesis transport protein
VSLQEYLEVLRAQWLLVLASVLACAAAAGLVAWAQTPTYAARAQLFVSTGGVPDDPSQAYQGGLFSQQRVVSYAEIVSSPPVARAVIGRLDLPETVQELQDKIGASVPPDTVLINVAVEDTSPRRAKVIADAVTEEFSRVIETLETPRGEENSPVKVSVTSPAQLPRDPVSPRTGIYVAFGVFGGVILGIAAALVREALDNRVAGGREAAEIAGGPVLGAIPEDSKAGRRPLIVMADPFSANAEAYRRLRTNLRILQNEHGFRAFVVSSPVESEGKTLTVANLGIAFAQAGHSVVLVDADLRRPTLAKILDLPPAAGLTDVLTDSVPLEAALRRWRKGLPLEVLGSGLEVLGSAREVGNASELLASGRFDRVLDSLTERVDVVILDSPALASAADAAVLARAKSGVILVTRVASTRAAELRDASEALRAVRGSVLGVVLNRVPKRKFSRYISRG